MSARDRFGRILSSNISNVFSFLDERITEDTYAAIGLTLGVSLCVIAPIRLLIKRLMWRDQQVIGNSEEPR